MKLRFSGCLPVLKTVELHLEELKSGLLAQDDMGAQHVVNGERQLMAKPELRRQYDGHDCHLEQRKTRDLYLKKTLEREYGFAFSTQFIYLHPVARYDIPFGSDWARASFVAIVSSIDFKGGPHGPPQEKQRQ